MRAKRPHQPISAFAPFHRVGGTDSQLVLARPGHLEEEVQEVQEVQWDAVEAAHWEDCVELAGQEDLPVVVGLPVGLFAGAHWQVHRDG